MVYFLDMCSENRSSLPNPQINLANLLSNCNLSVLQAAAMAAASANCQNVTPGNSSLLSFSNNLALALAAVSQNISNSNATLNQNVLRSQLSNVPLFATLMAAGKLDPALLNMISSNASGSTITNLVNNLLRGNVNNSKSNQSWRWTVVDKLKVKLIENYRS